MQQIKASDWVKISIANAFGNDKMCYQDRIDWVNDNRQILWHVKDKADEPFMYMKGLNALEDVEAKEPTGYMVGLDATASGIQIMSALSGCESGCINTNLMSNNRQDIYTKIADYMNKNHGTNVTRSDIKKPLMTSFYGSTKQPKLLFGEDTDELKAFYAAMEAELPGAYALLLDIQSCWDSEAEEYRWVLPDGFEVVMPVLDQVTTKIELDGLDGVTFTHSMLKKQPQKMGLSLAANVIHSIDGYIVREMIRICKNKGFDIATIHDSFWCHPNNVQTMREVYSDIMIQISMNGERILSNILKLITKDVNVNYTGLDNQLYKSFNTEYAIN